MTPETIATIRALLEHEIDKEERRLAIEPPIRCRKPAQEDSKSVMVFLDDHDLWAVGNASLARTKRALDEFNATYLVKA